MSGIPLCFNSHYHTTYILTAPIVTTAGHAIGQIRFRLDGCNIAGAGHKGGNGGQDELLRAWESVGLNT